MSYCIIIRGPAGVGKTTIAKKLTKLLSGYCISFDEILREHNLDYVPNDLCVPAYKMLVANKIIIPVAQEKLKAGQIVIFDGNFYHKVQIDDLIAQLKFPYVIFTLKATLEECFVRNKKRLNQLDEREVKNVFELVLQFDYGYVIDTTWQTAHEITNKIMTILLILKQSVK